MSRELVIPGRSVESYRNTGPDIMHAKEQRGYTTAVLKPFDYLRELVSPLEPMAGQEKGRIWVRAMHAEYGMAVGLLANHMQKEAIAGNDIRFTFDWFSDHHKRHDASGKEMSKEADDETYRMLSDLSSSGVLVTRTNQPAKTDVFKRFVLPQFRCDHTKLAVRNDTAYIGGVNLYEGNEGFNTIDFMVRINHPKVVDAIADQFNRTNGHGLQEDAAVYCSEDYILFAASGKINESIIYDTGLTMVRNASEPIRYMSQLMPTFELLDAFVERANAGIPIEIILSSEDNDLYRKRGYKFFYDRFRKKIDGNENISLIHYPAKVHAKLLMVGNSQALFGSDNLSKFGVLFGTREVSLWSTDRVLLDQLDTWYSDVLETISPERQEFARSGIGNDGLNMYVFGRKETI